MNNIVVSLMLLILKFASSLYMYAHRNCESVCVCVCLIGALSLFFHFCADTHSHWLVLYVQQIICMVVLPCVVMEMHLLSLLDRRKLESLRMDSIKVGDVI